MTCTALDSRLMRLTAFQNARGMAVAVSTTRSTPASIRSSVRPEATLADRGRRDAQPSLRVLRRQRMRYRLSMSLTVISPTQRYWSSTTSSFSMRCVCSIRFALSWLMPAHRDEISAMRHQLRRLFAWDWSQSARRDW